MPGPDAADRSDLAFHSDAGGPDAVSAASVVRSEELLQIGTEWVVAGRVRVHRRVVTEQHTIEVTVRREVIELHGETLDFHDGFLVGTELGGPAVRPPAAEPAEFVTLLREEVPVVTMQIRPYEKVTLATTRVREVDTVTETVRREQIDTTLNPLHVADEA